MKSGFAHFDESRRENFCAATLLLTMEVEPLVKSTIAGVVLSKLGIVDRCELVGFGREARLTADGDEANARVDIWLRFEASKPFYVFIEVKTHDRWDPVHVATQVRDQANRKGVANSEFEIRGSLLLAPQRLCDGVVSRDPSIPVLLWVDLLHALRALGSDSKLTQHCIKHLEESVDRPVGIRDRSLQDFEDATTTVACLKTFLQGCITEVGGKPSLTKLNTTFGDGEPRSRGGWAWHGISVPFKVGNSKYYVGIYKYVKVPPGRENDSQTLWLEAYTDPDGDRDPKVEIPFAPKTLSPDELAQARTLFAIEWRRQAKPKAP